MKKTVKKATTKVGRTVPPSKGAEMVKKAKVTFVPDKKSEYIWQMTIKDTQWVTLDIPPGETCTPRVRSSSTNSDGSTTFFCYRDGRYLDCAKTLDKAKEICERSIAWWTDKERAASDRRIKEYVDKYPNDIPPFLLLTAEERGAIRRQYPASAPATSKVSREVERREGEDPATTKLRAEVAAAKAAAGGGKQPRAAKVAAVAARPDAKLARLRDGNPKQEGSAPYKRWALLFEHCDKGSTVAEFLAAGGNPETLANAVKAGWVKA